MTDIMRTLKFIVDGETIKQDPSCDFSGLFTERKTNIAAKFIFSPEWEKKVKVAAFWSMLDVEYEPQEIVDDSCIIPVEALEKAAFKVQVLGKKGKARLTTNKLVIRQTGGKR